VNLKALKQPPVLITAAVIALVCLFELSSKLSKSFNIFQPLELITYDWRVRQAVATKPRAAENLGVIVIDDASIKAVNDQRKYTFPWPRRMYAELLKELSRQQAKVVGFDILFSEVLPRSPETDVAIMQGVTMSSDGYFAQQLRRSSNVVLAAGDGLLPVDQFRTNALATGDISTAGLHADGILRRFRPFTFYTNWHPVLVKSGANLTRMRVEPRRLVLLDDRGQPLLDNGKEVTVPLDKDGNMDVNELLERPLPSSQSPWQKPFTIERVWQMGVILAARELNLDLENAVIEPRQIILRGPGVERRLPLDAEGYLYINWTLTFSDRRLLQDSFDKVLTLAEAARQNTNAPMPWRGRLVMVGSTGTGNNISDIGPTPLEQGSYLVSKHWNVASSIITGQFVRESPLWLNWLVIIGLGVASFFITSKLGAPWSSVWLLVAAAAYVGIALWCFVQFHYWLPIVLPVLGAMLVNHTSLVTYQVIFEQAEKRRVKSIFNKVVSPNIVSELLRAEKLDLGGSRAMITVFFADVRGFTELTDVAQRRAEEYVRENKLEGAAAEACHDQQAKETLSTVNLYLATIADQIAKHNGTLDKYIGDCVMAFWGAPVPSKFHAVSCVKAAIDAQRAMYALNQERFAENKRRDTENQGRALYGKPPLPQLALLSLGTGINTGMAVVGLMGSEANVINYTVFGGTVNLASRLEGVSGRGRIIIGETTYAELKNLDPALAATCVSLEPVTVKGIKRPVTIYEVPWKPTEAAPAPKQHLSATEDNTQVLMKQAGGLPALTELNTGQGSGVTQIFAKPAATPPAPAPEKPAEPAPADPPKPH
jgi:class 3 adenylate cyclase/CHASE2 domain-containing sensor protein